VDDAVPGSPLVTEEISGPVAAVLRARDFEHALELANQTDFALTAGIVSRSPSHIERASANLKGCSIFVNRAVTGAVVGRQPFGGRAMSGIGSNTGGPDYLFQFVQPRVVTENTLRQGFAPAQVETSAGSRTGTSETGSLRLPPTGRKRWRRG
jgi:RHH-type proline utilization regulon transcriptional repressor/proline dehydrogenase/delta 1-pyrroline-5-carboxylate dehydrogenase